jgi:F420H(2)-dependent quinone reductase
VADFLKIADRCWPVLGPLMRAHGAVYRATRGRVGGRLPGVPPMLALDHVGARSGKRRTTPLVYMPDGEDFLIVAAKGGHPENPSWLYNLRAHPDTEIQIGSRRITVRAQGGRCRGTPAPVADGGHLQLPLAPLPAPHPAGDPAAHPRAAIRHVLNRAGRRL